MQLRFSESDLWYWSQRYPALKEGDHEIDEIARRARRRGWLTVSELQAICSWKTPRTKKLVAKNTRLHVESYTRVALECVDAEIAVEILQLLHGVGLPTATAILHWCSRQHYALLDVRALWTLQEPYRTGIWPLYNEFCRELASKHLMSMREVDRALWQYSRENQGPLTSRNQKVLA